MPRLADVVALLHGWYPPETADEWDAVGLVGGDPDDEVRRVLLAVDPALPVAREAAEWDADLLSDPPPAAPARRARRRGDHAEGPDPRRPDPRRVRAADRAHQRRPRPPGVSDALARTSGLRDVRPLAPSGPPLDKIVVFAPVGDAEASARALADAGAGQIGDYDTVTYTVAGEGRFRPLAGANPTVGSIGELEVVDELRVEALLPARPPRRRRPRACWRRTPTRRSPTTSSSWPTPVRR